MRINVRYRVYIYIYILPCFAALAPRLVSRKLSRECARVLGTCNYLWVCVCVYVSARVYYVIVEKSRKLRAKPKRSLRACA